MALNPGAGDAVGDFGFGDFDTGIDAMSDMEIFDLPMSTNCPEPFSKWSQIIPTP